MTPSPLLAFGFLTPLLLWGTLLAAAPLAIHLLFRRQYRETPWAAMQFLVAATKRQSRWSHLDQWLLLAIRMLIPLAAALALAGPMLDLATGSTSSAPVHRLLVLDVSLSTQAREEGRSRWSRIRNAAMQIVEQGKPGDTWQLYTLGDGGLKGIIPEPTFLSQPVIEELQQLEATAAGGAISDGLTGLEATLKAAASGRREVYFFTDAQRTQWFPADPVTREMLASSLQGLDQQARVVWVDVAEGVAANTAVTEVSLLDPFVLVGRPLRAIATVQAFGEQPLPATLEWLVDGRLVASQSLAGAAGSEVRRELRYVPVAAGDLRIEARIAADELPVDDRRGAVCVVRDVIRVLLVDGRPSGIPFENATDCVRLALSPVATEGTPGRIEPTVISDGQLLSENLVAYDVVFLCDVPQLTDREGELLARYTAAGGGLVIALGAGVRPDTYRTALRGDQRNLLPGGLGEIVGDARRREQAFAFASDEFTHPILAPFRGNPNTGFELSQTFAYRRLQPEEDARVAVAFENGDPAILERGFGRGRVLLVATAMDRSWGTWPVWGHTFVPMIHEMVRYLVASPLKSRTGEVGAVLQATLPPGMNSAELQLRDPADHRQRVELGRNGVDNAVLIEETSQPGFYALERAGSGSNLLWFAINPPASESDLTPLTAGELREGLFGGREIDALDDDEVATGRDSAASPLPVTDSPVSRGLLGLVLILLIGEPFFAWNRRLGSLIAAALTLIAAAGLFLGTAGVVAAAAMCGMGLVWFGRQPQTA